MFFPLHDDTLLRIIRFQFVTGLIIAANVLVFLFMSYATPPGGELAVAAGFGIVPALLTGSATLDPSLAAVPAPVTLVTYMFLHGGWVHLLSNMAFMWVFADNVEDAYGHLGFALLYLICGVLAALAHTVAAPRSNVPLVGASGAVSGVMAAYMVLFPRARVWVLLLMKVPMRLSAVWALAGWIGFQFISLLADDGNGEVLVAWWAHIGGFAAGLALTWPLRHRLLTRFRH